MIVDPTKRRGLQRRLKHRFKRRATAPKPDAAATPLDRLLWAAQNGQFEALVHQARPERPVATVTPEEREAELRAAGRWPADKPDPQAVPPETEPPPRELTPNEQYIAEHCHSRKRRPADTPRRHREYQCLTEYDVLTGGL